jgi:threonine synthase
MDILISSNLERLIYLVSDAEHTSKYMEMLNSVGHYQVDDEIKAKIDENFVGYFANEDQTADTIAKYYNIYDYLMDTHTAVAFSALESYRNETNDSTKTIVASTASPYKFAKDVYSAIYGENDFGDLTILEELSLTTGTKIPEPLSHLDKKDINFTSVRASFEMYDEILKFLE